MEPPGAGSCWPAPKREKTSPATESSREMPRLYTGGDGGGIRSFSSLVARRGQHSNVAPDGRCRVSFGLGVLVFVGVTQSTKQRR